MQNMSGNLIVFQILIDKKILVLQAFQYCFWLKQLYWHMEQSEK